MADIRHRVQIAASPEQVYQELTTKDGFSRWWTRDVAGDDGAPPRRHEDQHMGVTPRWMTCSAHWPTPAGGACWTA
jgi:uncharacterized protein YndB with AHSA1/START domain